MMLTTELITESFSITASEITIAITVGIALFTALFIFRKSIKIFKNTANDQLSNVKPDSGTIFLQNELNDLKRVSRKYDRAWNAYQKAYGDYSASIKQYNKLRSRV